MDTDQISDIAVLTKNLLDEKGIFYPADLLIQRGYLSLQQYLEWEIRGKKLDYLERMIAIPSKQIAEQLQFACGCAKEFSDSSNKMDRLMGDKPPFRDVETRETFGEYFFNNSTGFDSYTVFIIGNPVAKILIDKLLSESDEVASIMKLYADIPARFPWKSELGILVDAKLPFGQLDDNIEKSLSFIVTKLAPLACMVFGNNSHKFLDPIWSHAKELIEQEHDWRNHPDLMLYNAIINKHIGEDKAALGLFCDLCWLYPRTAEKCMCQEIFPDEKLIKWWGQYQEHDDISVEEFPSFLLLMGYNKYDFEKANVQCASKDFQLMQGLILGDDSVREELKAISSGLFRLFLSTKSQ